MATKPWIWCNCHSDSRSYQEYLKDEEYLFAKPIVKECKHVGLFTYFSGGKGGWTALVYREKLWKLCYDSYITARNMVQSGVEGLLKTISFISMMFCQTIILWYHNDTPSCYEVDSSCQTWLINLRVFKVLRVLGTLTTSNHMVYVKVYYQFHNIARNMFMYFQGFEVTSVYTNSLSEHANVSSYIRGIFQAELIYAWQLSFYKSAGINII